MYLHRVYSTHGRLIPKPEEPYYEIEEEIFDDHATIHDQIESLRTKIGLKERYTRVLAEEYEESRQGATSILQDLYLETRELRLALITALGAEKQAIQNALRTQTKFGLAMKDVGSTRGVTWMEDKLFNATKILNYRLHELIGKRKKLEEAERLVIMIEKWPRPGTLPWEIEALHKFHVLENKIETVRIKKETAYILHSKYFELKRILREEKSKYSPSIRLLENQIRLQKHELKGIQNMLQEANMFRDSAYRNLIQTEKEASANRRARRKQMSKVKKIANAILAHNHPSAVSSSKSLVRIKLVAFEEDTVPEEQNLEVKVSEMIKQKRHELELYEGKSKRIVGCMRVHNLLECIPRFKATKFMARILKEQKLTKDGIRDDLIKKRDQLLLILAHFKFQGLKLTNESQIRLAKWNSAIATLTAKLEEVEHQLHEHGDILVELRLGVQAVLTKVDNAPRFQRRSRDGDLKSQLKTACLKIKNLVQEVSDYETMFRDQKSDKNYSQYAKPTIVPFRLVRFGGPSPEEIEESEEDENDDDMPDSRVPGRLEIKAKSKRVKQQAILRRGLK